MTLIFFIIGSTIKKFYKIQLKEKISYATHNKWFKKAIINPKIKIFILYLNNIPIGQIRFNEKGKKYIIDYSLDEFVRGRNFGKN